METDNKKKEEMKRDFIILGSGILLLILLIMTISLAFVLKSTSEKISAQAQELEDINKETHILLNNIEDKDKRIEELETMVSNTNKELIDKANEAEAKLKEVNEVNKKLLEDNKTLLEAQKEWDEQLNTIKERLDVYEEYDYAMFDTTGKRTDLNYDYIKELEELTAFRAVNDIDLYLSWIMIESQGKSNAKNPNSTAKGFAQFLDGTSKSVYNIYLVDKYDIEWYPNIVIDRPDICLDMMQEYVNYLYEETYSIEKTIDCYRGLHDTPYLNLLNKYLSNNDKSIETISKATNERKEELDKAVG